MKRVNHFFGVAICVAVFLVPIFTRASESIPEFISDTVINGDGTFLVTETITYDFGDEQRHGIFRTIPLEHSQEASVWYKKRYIDVLFLQIQLDGDEVPYTEKASSKEVLVKIGDPDKTITGEHTYTISYTVSGGLTYTDGKNPDFYWNVTGNQWPAAIDNVTATLQAPVGALRNEYSCYKGSVGEVLPCDSIEINGSKMVYTVTDLAEGQGMTIAQSLNGQKVAYTSIQRVPIYFSLVPFLLTAVGFIFYRAFRFRTQHNPHATIIPEYEPYPGVLPMYTGVVVDGRLDSRDITAGIMYLAQQGFLKIKKTDRKAFFLFEVDDYEVTLLRSWEDAPTAFHKEILSIIFSTYEVGEVVSLGNLKKDTAKQRTNYQTVQSLKSAIREDLITQGFYESAFTLNKNYVLGLLTMLLLFGYGIYTVTSSTGVLLFVIATITVSIIFAVIVHQRRTKKGYQARNHIKGFKEFLSVTDKERFSFHNAPQKSPEQFMQYLPYAIALGVEGQWAEVFKDIPMQNPEWYESTSGGTFSAKDFSKDIGAFSDSFTGSSGSSPSSGGGSSGGGSGGGGGGSW
jgi:uncharacterized membrane protein